MHAATPGIAAALMALTALLAGAPAHAESLRCARGSVNEGDSRLSLVYKCGQPAWADQYCAPAYAGPWPLPAPYVGTAVPCLPTEDWLYERGEGNLAATVRLRNGVVRAIFYGRPR